MSKEMQEHDDIDRLMELSEREIPAPGRAFRDTLEELRRQHPSAKHPVIRTRNWLVLAGLGTAAALAVGLLTFSVFALSSKPAPSNASVVALPVATPTETLAAIATVTALPATTTAAPTNTSEPTNTVAPSATSSPTVQATTAPASPTTEPTFHSANVTNAANQTKPQTQPTNNKTAVLPSVPSGFMTPIPVATKGDSQYSDQPTTIIGTVLKYDQGAGVVQVAARAGQVTTVKLKAYTTINRDGKTSKASDIKVGDSIAVTGVFNEQNELDAGIINLGVTVKPPQRPVGDPSFPIETRPAS